MKYKTVFVNGCFDILHVGHFTLLQYASSFGCLHIAIDSDERIKKLKGLGRPFFNLNERTYNLSMVKGVENIYNFSTDQELENIIKELNPYFMIVGSDYKGKKVIGSEYAKQLIYFERNEKYSTTKILNYYAKIGL